MILTFLQLNLELVFWLQGKYIEDFQQFMESVDLTEITNEITSDKWLSCI